MWKTLAWYLVIAALIAYVGKDFYDNRQEMAREQELSQQASVQRQEAREEQSRALKERHKADAEWETRLRDATGSLYGDVFSIHIESILCSGSPILITGEIVDISRSDVGGYDIYVAQPPERVNNFETPMT